ncbi:Aldo-keto reductase family 1 member A1-A [Pseudolycoriella hygida]|uniref:Aldo-keto reductase family 1 member A1-A n=1 Tax=Pseudolycoriella hygida TaxID=35572 RepID=A0A9Q0MZI2_9DIPT|nr:Aldo-keto reductase family 1 member A1-A [Pseudolycoriella hygida]
MAKLTSECACPLIEMNNGCYIPAIGLGTYEVTGDVLKGAVKDAIDCGYRLIDTAYRHQNERELGAAVREKIEEGVIKRSDIFITTKLWSTFHEPNDVEYACQLSLANLGLDYIDLYLIHWPFSFYHISDTDFTPQEYDGTYLMNNVDYIETWRAMEYLVWKGLVRNIGLSNFNSEQIDRILKSCYIKPVVNQIECSPHINQKKLINFCWERGIRIISYTPLAKANLNRKKPDFLFDEDVIGISKKYQKTPAQIALKFLLQMGTILIPKSTNRRHMNENMQIFDFYLTEDEMNIMGKFDKGKRTSLLLRFSNSIHYPFNIEF